MGRGVCFDGKLVLVPVVWFFLVFGLCGSLHVGSGFVRGGFWMIGVGCLCWWVGNLVFLVGLWVVGLLIYFLIVIFFFRCCLFGWIR